MAGRAAVPVRPDVAVFPVPEEVHPDLHPFPGAGESLNAERWSDADRDVVRRVCRRIRDESLEVRRGLKAADAGKLAVHAQLPVGAVLGRHAWAVPRAHPEARWMAPAFSAAVLYKRDADRSAA